MASDSGNVMNISLCFLKIEGCMSVRMRRNSNIIF